MRILVTGSRGNVGSELVPYLKCVGHEVFGIDIVQGVGDNYLTCSIDSIDLAGVFNSFQPEIVIHLAAMVSRVTCEKSRAWTIQTNITGTQNIISLCQVFGSKLVFFSTSEVYGNLEGVLSEGREDLRPNNFYGISKLIGEQLVKYAGIDYLIIRPFMMYNSDRETIGDHRSAMIRFITNLREGKEIEVHEGSGRSWLHMDDAVQIIEKLLIHTGTVNIGHSEYVMTIDLAKMICMFTSANRDLIKIVKQPEKMTLSKRPCLRRQVQLTKYNPVIDVIDGLKRII